MSITVSSSVFSEESNDKTKNKALNSVQSQIEKQKSTVSNVKLKRAKLEKQLKQDDLAISKITKAMLDTEASLANTKNKLKELAIEKNSLTTQKKQQEQILAKQLRTAYANGHHDYLKLILNQTETSKTQRTLTYYQYLNDARIKELDRFQETLTALLQVTSEHQEQEITLTQLQREQALQKEALKSSKATRAKTIKSLNRELLSAEQQLEKLEIEEQSLVNELARLAELAKTKIELNGLKSYRNKLKWPIKGRMLHRFGTRKQGYLKWKGVLISSPVGNQVKSIHNGTVLFSDWL